ncbi:hypothetical protein HK104_011354, partial [Borealophlyctis nickersoniae]
MDRPQQQPSSASSTQPQTSITFSYPITTYDGLDSSPNNSGPNSSPSTTGNVQNKVNELIRHLCDQASREHGVQVIFSHDSVAITRQQGRYEFNYSVSVLGPVAAVQAARGMLLRNNPTQTMVVLKCHRPLLLNASSEMRAPIKRKLDEIMSSTRTQITCVGQNYDRVKVGSSPGGASSAGAVGSGPGGGGATG